MALIKLQDRFKIYKTLLTRMKYENGVGICYHLGDLAFKITGHNFTNVELMMHFPEIKKHKPSPPVSMDFWWHKNKDGYEMRRWVCREAIREISKKLLKYQKMQQS